jgi:hypothetical protein
MIVMSQPLRLCIILLIIGMLMCLPRNWQRVGAQNVGKPQPKPTPTPSVTPIEPKKRGVSIPTQPKARPSMEKPSVLGGQGNERSRTRASLPTSHQQVVSAFNTICRPTDEPKQGEAVRYLLVVGSTISVDTIRQLMKLAELNTKGLGVLIAIALLSKDHPQYNAIVSGVGNSTYLGLINTYPHPERIDATFFVGFSEDLALPVNPASTKRYTNRALDGLVKQALAEWGDVYVFANPAIWAPLNKDAIISTALSSKRIIWAGDGGSDDLGDFLETVRSRDQRKGRIN